MQDRYLFQCMARKGARVFKPSWLALLAASIALDKKVVVVRLVPMAFTLDMNSTSTLAREL